MSARTPAENRRELWTFFGAYFNQDFPDLYGEPDDVIRKFVEDSPAQALERAANEAEDLARSTNDEQELRQAMFDLGLEYLPWADGWDSSHAWLRHLVVTFRVSADS